MVMTVAIDGPAAAGKSTIAKEVAKRLGYVYIDTGAMYRCVTLLALKKGIDPKDEKAVETLIPEIQIDMKPNHVIFLNGEDVSEAIRTREVADNVSYVASYKKIRLFLVEIQRKLAQNVSIVMDGRDIGTYVLPNANVKIFQIATVETRAQRRYKENLEKGISCSLEDIKEELEKRDYIDSHRSFAPLSKAEDAIEIDTSFMTINEVVSEVIRIVHNKMENING